MDIRESLIGYMKKGIKGSESHLIGMEAEHFIVRADTLEAVSYYGAGGIEEILAKLIRAIPGSRAFSGDDLLGFAAPGYTITLEPAAQLEISIDAKNDIYAIEQVYGDFLKKLSGILSGYGYRYIATGTQPVSKVRDLKLIPKERYRLMDVYFSETGTGGIEMMRGTCSVQTSVDYYSEEDFTAKMRAAYFYSPILKLLSDNSRFFEGKRTGGRLYRTDIWNRTDPSRCGIVPGIFKEDYGFGDYADFLLAMPLIFAETENGNVYTGSETVGQIWAGRCPDEEELIHIQSMAFPDVRVKQYIELRSADSMPEKFAIAYCALVKGLLYSRSGLDYAADVISKGHLTEHDIITSEGSLMQSGYEGMIYGRPARAVVSEVLSLAEDALSDAEGEYIKAFREGLHEPETIEELMHEPE